MILNRVFVWKKCLDDAENWTVQRNTIDFASFRLLHGLKLVLKPIDLKVSYFRHWDCVKK